jgi:hypothetical protein
MERSGLTLLLTAVAAVVIGLIGVVSIASLAVATPTEAAATETSSTVPKEYGSRS